MQHGAAARCGRPAKRRAPGPRMRTRRFSPGRASPDSTTPAHPAAPPLACPTLPRLTGAVGLRCSAQTRSSPDCVAPYRPVHRPTAPRLLSRPRVARLPPLPRLTANRLTAPPHNRIMDDGLYLFVGHKARASPNRTTSLTRLRAARLPPLPRLTANHRAAPLRNRVADDGLYPFVGYEARASPDCTTSAQPPAPPLACPAPTLDREPPGCAARLPQSTPDCEPPDSAAPQSCRR